MRASEIEDKSRQMLLKLRKRSASWLNAKRVEELFTILNSGWKIEKAPMYMPASDHRGLLDQFRPSKYPDVRVYGTYGKREPRLEVISLNKEQIEQYHSDLKAVSLDSIPELTRKSPKAFIGKVSDIQTKETSYGSNDYRFTFEYFLKVNGHRITSPEGKVFDVCQNNVLGTNGAVTFADWFNWAVDNTSLMSEILNILGMEPHVKRSDMPREAKPGQTIGTCAICNRSHVVRNNKMVLHGYQRPGIGYIVGDCFGVGYKPYELSPEACEAFIPVLQKMQKQRQKTLQDLQNDRVDEFYETRMNYKLGRRETITIGRDNPAFERLRKERINKMQQEIKGIDEMIAEMKQKIKNWEPGELRTA